MDELLDFLNSFYPLTEDLITHLGKILKPKELSQGDLLLKAGHYCEEVYFVSKGLLRIYYYNNRRAEVNKWFMQRGDVMFAVRSFLDQKPSTEFIQALDDSILYSITHKELQNIYKEHIFFNIHGRKLLEKYYKMSEDRDEIVRMPEAIQRYQHMLDNFPDLVNVVPDKHLASFLRMTPVTLSRLRNNRMKKQEKL